MLSSGLVRAGFVRGRSRGGEMIQRKIHFKTVEKCREKFKAVEKVKNPTVGDGLEGIWECFFSASLEKLLRCERSWNGQMGLGSSGMAPAGGGGGKRRGSCSGMGLCSGCCAGCVWQLREMLFPFPQPWIRGRDEPLAPSRCSWNSSPCPELGLSTGISLLQG